MKQFNKEERDIITNMLSTEYGEAFVGMLKERVLNSSTFPSQAQDGLSIAILQSMQEGEMNFIRRLISIRESKNGNSSRK